MAIFRRTARRGRAAESSDALLLGGYDDLEVVGESQYQDNLWSLVGGRGDSAQRVRENVIAILTPEPENAYDRNAVVVTVNGLKVGYLSREDAELIQPGLLALSRVHAKPVALGGAIVGGGIRQDGPGKLGVFLSFNPEDFGLGLAAPDDEPSVRTGLSEALAATSGSYSDELARLSSLPKTDVAAIAELRRYLAQESNPIRRHFAYAEIEARLYRCRDIFASALEEFDQSCGQHDAEMDGICQAFMAEFGSVPLLELYRQMAVRQQKIHDYQAALRWAERGISLYSGRAATPEGIDDLRHRAATYRAKLASSPPV